MQEFLNRDIKKKVDASSTYFSMHLPPVVEDHIKLCGKSATLKRTLLPLLIL
jgi:hypothetical protein